MSEPIVHDTATSKRNNLIVSVASNFTKTCSANKMTLLEASITLGLIVAYFSKNTNITVDEIQAVVTNTAKTAPVKP